MVFYIFSDDRQHIIKRCNHPYLFENRVPNFALMLAVMYGGPDPQGPISRGKVLVGLEQGAQQSSSSHALILEGLEMAGP